jgi:hypothetical protein
MPARAALPRMLLMAITPKMKFDSMRSRSSYLHTGECKRDVTTTI